MQFRKRSCDEGLQSYGCTRAVKLTEKDRKFTFQAIVKKKNRLARFDD